ncbi:MAG: helix-turn-helix domain-containing protein [Clostridiales bacterium]|nr:helix-turn-helix domain-containing protein [Clostridiales bacterium]
MTFGQKLKQYRSQLNITQKDLAEQMNVTFQTISKWESDINEPDFASVRKLAKIFDCTIEDLLADGDEEKEEAVEETNEEVAEDSDEKEPVTIDTCRDCGQSIKEGEIIHHVERRTPSGVKEMVSVCDKCFTKHEQEMNRRAKEIEDSLKAPPAKEEKGIFRKITDRDDKKPLIWAIVLGIVAAIGGIVVSALEHETLGLGLAIACPFLSGYSVMAVIYCIFAGSYISDVFLAVASWSIKFPGLIWEFSLDGFMWLIAMKILFAIVGALIGIAVFLFALSLAIFLSIFSFVPVLIYNKTHYSN